MKKILFAASECVPFIKTGGLADVCGALPKTFDHKDWDVRVVIPNYSCIPEKYRSQFEYVTHFYMACGSYIPSKYVGVLQYNWMESPIISLIIRSILTVSYRMEICAMILKNSRSSTKRYCPCFR